jgi:hypothetical protein
MDLAKVRVDVTRSKAGEWVKDIPGLDDIELKVRGSNSPHFRTAQVKAQRAIPRDARKDGLVDPEAADAALGRALAEILLDWKNVSVGGVEIPHTAEAALTILTDPEMSVFRDGVAYAADYVASLRKEEEDAALGK